MRKLLTIVSAIVLIGAAPAPRSGWSPAPWLDDLAQAREAFQTKYANIDWLEHGASQNLFSNVR